MIITGEQVLNSSELRDELINKKIIIKSITFGDGTKLDNEICKDMHIENVKSLGRTLTCFTKGLWTNEIIKGITFDVDIV